MKRNFVFISIFNNIKIVVIYKKTNKLFLSNHKNSLNY